MVDDTRNSLSAETRARLASIGQPLHFGPGDAVFREGDRYRGFFVVERGCYKVFRTSIQGKEALLAFFRPGEPFAMLPLFRGKSQYPASCMALQHGKLMLYPRDAVDRLLDVSTALRQELQSKLIELAVFFRDKSSMLMLESAEDRVISFLESMGADRAPTYLQMAKNQVALYLGITPEAFSRALRRLKAKGIVQETGGLLEVVGVSRRA